MNKSPKQWSHAFSRMTRETDDMVLTIQLTRDQIGELSRMMSVLDAKIGLTELRKILEE